MLFLILLFSCIYFLSANFLTTQKLHRQHNACWGMNLSPDYSTHMFNMQLSNQVYVDWDKTRNYPYNLCLCVFVESTALPYRRSIGNSLGHCPSSSLCSTFYTIQRETLAAILQKNGNENSSRAPVSHPVGRKVTPLVWDWCAKSDCRRLLLLLPEGAHGGASFTLECKRFDILCTFLWLFSFVCVCVFCVWSQ